MTDFIHEHPKDEAPQEKKPAYVPPKTEKERQKKVYTYVAILFIVAMLLIAWSFLMSHRSNQQIISELKESTSTLQSTFNKNEELERRIDTLEKSYAILESENARLKQELEAAQQELALYHAADPQFSE